MNEDMEVQDLANIILEIGSRCWNCNFCFSVCPNFDSTRGFQVQGPSGILQSIYYAIKWADKLDASDRDSLREIVYSCTTCKSCEITCKNVSAGVPVLEAIETGRMYLLEKLIGPLPEQRSVLESIYKYGNPYSQSPDNRLSWAGNLTIKLLPKEEAEVLYYVGCTAAYEPELNNIPRSLVKILQFLGVDFGILEAEICCGDPVRSLGDELLFKEIASQNLEKFKASGTNTIITTSPHCLNAFLKKYEEIGRTFKILHYTEFLHGLLEEKKPEFKKQIQYTVTYHDPCYLSKHNDIYAPPRALIRAVPGTRFVEMPKSGKDSLCCGGGGGRVYATVEEEKRLSDSRIEQALGVGADLLLTACPWCHIMLSNSVKDLHVEGKIRVLDIAELLAQALSL